VPAPTDQRLGRHLERPSVNARTWLLFAGASFLLSLTPGPNGPLALTHGGLHGARRTTATALGGVVGFAVAIALSMSGLGALLAASDGAFDAIRWAGALYLVWLGVRTWRTPLPTPGTSGDGERGRRSSFGLFGEGLPVAISDPETILFFIAFLPQFIDPSRSLVPQFAVMAATLAVIEFVVEIALAAGSASILPWLARGRNRRWFQRLTGRCSWVRAPHCSRSSPGGEVRSRVGMSRAFSAPGSVVEQRAECTAIARSGHAIRRCPRAGPGRETGLVTS